MVARERESDMYMYKNVSPFNVLDVSCVCVKKGGVCCRLDNGFSDCLDMHSVSGLWSV